MGFSRSESSSHSHVDGRREDTVQAGRHEKEGNEGERACPPDRRNRENYQAGVDRDPDSDSSRQCQRMINPIDGAHGCTCNGHA